MSVIAKYKFNNTVYDLFPTFNTGYEYTYEDVLEDNNTTRTISSESVPTTIKFDNDGKLALLEVLELDISGLTNMSNMFNGCNVLTSVGDLSNWNVSNVNNMSGMFYNCNALLTINISNWDTGNVNNMSGMFYGCKALTSVDLSNWNVDSVTDMSHMFYGCKALTSVGDLSNWNVGNVNNMSGMFYHCTKITELDLSNWNTSNVTNMCTMFRDANTLHTINISGFVISDTTLMDNIFYGTWYVVPHPKIIMKNCDYSSINKIIESLISKEGTLDITNVNDMSQVDIATAESKGWTIINDSVVSGGTSLVINPNKPKKKMIVGNYKIMHQNKSLYNNIK